MQPSKKYIHDRLVLFLLSVNTFLAIASSVLLLLRLDMSRLNQVVQYRPTLGLDAYTPGPPRELLSFLVFNVFILVFHTFLSIKVYHLRRYFAITILVIATLLIVLSLLISDALLGR